MKESNELLIKNCETDGLVVDEHEVAVDEHKIVTIVYQYHGDIYVHVKVDGETLGFKPVEIRNHRLEF